MSNSATPWTAPCQASLSFTISQSLLKLMGLRVSYGGTGQQWASVGTGALAAADLGDVACGISPLGGG